jgi:hypothetical protein
MPAAVSVAVSVAMNEFAPDADITELTTFACGTGAS